MKMLVKTSLSALALLLALPACAQQAPAPAITDADPALWVVKDEDTTIYLFGTVHVLKPGLSWFDEAVKTAFDASDTVVLELVQPEPAAMQGLVMAKGMLPAGAPALTQQLPEGKRAAYAKALGDLGIPAAAFDRMKPWMAAVNLSLLPIMKAGYDPSQGPEQVLAAAAKSANKPVIGLETAEQQLGYFDGLSQTAQVGFLTSTVDEMPKMGTEMGRMVDIWSKGDPDSLAVMLNEGLKDTPEVAQTILYDRNARWATWIDQRLKTPGTVFIAVGAGHLAGDKSVISNLATHKLAATRIKY